MKPPLALILDDDATVRRRACDTLARAGVTAVAVASPREAVDVLRAHPAAVVAMVDGDPTQQQIAHLQALVRLRAQDGRSSGNFEILGRSEVSDTLRGAVKTLAAQDGPVLFAGEAGSGRTHAARSLHDLSAAATPFVVVPGDDPTALTSVSAQREGIVFVPSIEQLPWPAQEALAAALSSGSARARVVASSALDPRAAADDGRLARPLVAAFADAIVQVPPLRERPADVAVLARAFIAELCRLNGLAPFALAPEAVAALEAYAWPGNVRQLRSAIESAVILAHDGAVRARDLPEYLRANSGPAEQGARAGRRFRDAKRAVVEAFERAYLEELLKRHHGNVTGAAEQSGMLRSALQRLLRKHDLHSADFRGRGAPGPYAS